MVDEDSLVNEKTDHNSSCCGDVVEGWDLEGPYLGYNIYK